jgi:hypothetical protein
MNDFIILELYRSFSEDMYAAGFMIARPETVREFRRWLLQLAALPMEPYEVEMLAEYARQQQEEA